MRPSLTRRQLSLPLSPSLSSTLRCYVAYVPFTHDLCVLLQPLIVAQDVEACNGIIQVVDNVLLPGSWLHR
jgi:hypothetical protein